MSIDPILLVGIRAVDPVLREDIFFHCYGRAKDMVLPIHVLPDHVEEELFFDLKQGIVVVDQDVCQEVCHVNSHLKMKQCNVVMIFDIKCHYSCENYSFSVF